MLLQKVVLVLFCAAFISSMRASPGIISPMSYGDGRIFGTLGIPFIYKENYWFAVGDVTGASDSFSHISNSFAHCVYSEDFYREDADEQDIYNCRPKLNTFPGQNIPLPAVQDISGSLTLPSGVIAIGDQTYVFMYAQFDWEGDIDYPNPGTNVAESWLYKGDPSTNCFNPTGVWFGSDSNFLRNSPVLSAEDDDYVYIYSTGDSKKSDIYLARVMSNHIEDPTKWQYFSGTYDVPAWTTNQTAAVSILAARAGEISAAYNSYMNAYVLSYVDYSTNYPFSDTTGFIFAKSKTPYGPWYTSIPQEIPDYVYLENSYVEIDSEMTFGGYMVPDQGYPNEEVFVILTTAGESAGMDWVTYVYSYWISDIDFSPVKAPSFTELCEGPFCDCDGPWDPDCGLLPCKGEDCGFLPCIGEDCGKPVTPRDVEVSKKIRARSVKPAIEAPVISTPASKRQVEARAELEAFIKKARDVKATRNDDRSGSGPEFNIPSSDDLSNFINITNEASWSAELGIPFIYQNKVWFVTGEVYSRDTSYSIYNAIGMCDTEEIETCKVQWQYFPQTSFDKVVPRPFFPSFGDAATIPTGAITLNGVVYVFMSNDAHETFLIKGDPTTNCWSVTPVYFPTGSAFAFAYPMLDTTGQYLYIYGVPNFGGVSIARVKPAQFENQAAWEYYSTFGWTKQPYGASTVIRSSNVNGGELGFFLSAIYAREVSVAWNAYKQMYLMVTFDYESYIVLLFEAPSPEGPWLPSDILFADYSAESSGPRDEEDQPSSQFHGAYIVPSFSTNHVKSNRYLYVTLATYEQPMTYMLRYDLANPFLRSIGAPQYGPISQYYNGKAKQPKPTRATPSP